MRATQQYLYIFYDFMYFYSTCPVTAQPNYTKLNPFDGRNLLTAMMKARSTYVFQFLCLLLFGRYCSSIRSANGEMAELDTA